MSVRKETTGRKLLVATVGLATASYVGCGRSLPGKDPPPTSGNLLPPPDAAVDTKSPDTKLPEPPVGNLVAPPPPDATDGLPPSPDVWPVGNLMDPPPDVGPVGNLVPPPPFDALGDAPKDAPVDLPREVPPIGNLVAPPPFDAGPDTKQGKR